MVERRTRIRAAGLLAAGLLLAACGSSAQPAPPRLLTDDVTWVSTDGRDGRVHVGVVAKADASDVRIRVRGAKVARFARLEPGDRRCRANGRDVECRLGSVQAGSTQRLTPVLVKPRAEADPKDGLELPIAVFVHGGKIVTHRTTLQIVRKATFLAKPERPLKDVAAGGLAHLRPTIMNVGPVSAADVHLSIYATDGGEYASAFRNCRPTTVGGGALCTFRQKVPAHAAVTTDHPLAFRLPQMIRGNLSYLAREGPDPDSAPEYYGSPAVGAPELRLIPANPRVLRSETGGLAWWGGFLDIQTHAKARIVARGANVQAKAGRSTVLVGVDNASPRIVDAIALPDDPFLGSFTVEIPEGVTVVYIPYPGEEGWGDCSPHKPGQRRYICRIPERLDQGQPLLQPFVVKVDPRHIGRPGRVTLHLRPDARDWDSSTADNSAAIVVR